MRRICIYNQAMNLISLCILVSVCGINAFFGKRTTVSKFSIQMTETFEIPMDDGEVSWETDADIRLRRLREYLRLNNITYQSIIDDGKKTFWENPHHVPFLFI